MYETLTTGRKSDDGRERDTPPRANGHSCRPRSFVTRYSRSGRAATILGAALCLSLLLPDLSAAQSAKQKPLRTWRPLKVPEAGAVHCMKVRQLKGGFNVSNVEIGNLCNYKVNATGICKGEESKLVADYPYSGVYTSPAGVGDVSAPPGQFRPAPTIENCHRRDKGHRIIACRAPHRPYFMSNRIGAGDKVGYMCFHGTKGEFLYDKAQAKRVQSALARAGFSPGPVDGSLGNMTRAAIRNWQRSKGHPETGEFSDEQLAALMGVDAGQVTRHPKAGELPKEQARAQKTEMTCADYNNNPFTWDGQKYVHKFDDSYGYRRDIEFYGECKNGKLNFDSPYKYFFGQGGGSSLFGKTSLSLLKGPSGKLYYKIAFRTGSASGTKEDTFHQIEDRTYGLIPPVKQTCIETLRIWNSQQTQAADNYYVAVASDKLMDGGKNRECLFYILSYRINGEYRRDLVKKDMFLPVVRASSR